MRPRIKKGLLVASSNPIIHMLSKKLVIEIVYTVKHEIVRRNIIGTASGKFN